MKDKKMYILLVISILFAVVGVSLAFFSLNIIGNDTAKYNKITTGDLELVFTDDNEVSLDGAFPGDSITKTISVKNTGTKEVSYNIVWQELLNEITNNELVIDGTCKNLNSSNTEDGTCNAISKKAVKEGNITSNIPIKPGYTQEYEVKITFIDTGKLQNYNKNKSFKGKLGLTESSAKTIYCTYDGELTQGAEYVNGQYTYRYMQEGKYTDSTSNEWQNIEIDGWGIQLTNKESTNEVNSQLCTYINNRPVVSMSATFMNSKANSLDLSSFNTSNVVNMKNTFNNNETNSLDLSSFNTSNVTSMQFMFNSSYVITLDLSNFNTSNVTTMNGMFQDAQVSTLDVSNFDTSKVINMSSMFANLQSSVLDVSNFNTSSVEFMTVMFGGTIIEILDLSSFDTSKVKNTFHMFDMSSVKTIYVSNKFVVDNITNSKDMFINNGNLIGGLGTTFEDNNVNDKTYAHIDGGTSNPGYFTDIADKPVEPYSFSSDSWATIANAVKNNNISKYSVGDTKTINLGTYGTHTVRIANTSTPSECSVTGFSQTACGFVIEFADIITTHAMNDTATNVGGWPASSMYTFVNNDIYNSLPYILKSRIIDTTVISGHGSTSGEENFTSTDKLYLLTPKEIYSDIPGSSDTAHDFTRTLDYYISIGSSVNKYIKGAIKNHESKAKYWLLRTANYNNTSSFFGITTYGSLGKFNSSSYFGVSPAFRIG